MDINSSRNNLTHLTDDLQMTEALFLPSEGYNHSQSSTCYDNVMNWLNIIISIIGFNSLGTSVKWSTKIILILT